MFEELQKESKEKLSGLSQSDLQKTYLKAVNFFGNEELPTEISASTVHNFIWSQDPVTTEGGVLDFCSKNELIKSK